MFSSEVWGHQMKPNNDTELSFVKFCKHILGVNRRSINKAVMNELGVYPFFIDAKLNIISFYLYLKGSKNILLSESLNHMEILNSEWYKCANKLISDHITNLDQYKYCNKKQKGEKDSKISHETAQIKITTAICFRMESRHWELKQVKFLQLMSSMAWVKSCFSEKSKNLNKLLVFEALYP